MFCIFESVFATVWFEQVRLQRAHLTVLALSHRLCSEPPPARRLLVSVHWLFAIFPFCSFPVLKSYQETGCPPEDSGALKSEEEHYKAPSLMNLPSFKKEG